MDEILRTKWYLIEHKVGIINNDGFPTTHYECYISTHPEPNKGYRIMDVRRWFSRDEYDGWIEKGIGEYIVKLHNSVYDMEYRPFEDAPPKKKWVPLHRPPPWPKGVPRKRPDGSKISFEEARKIAESNSQESSEPERPVHVQTSEVKENIQPAKRKAVTATDLYGDNQEPVNYVNTISNK